MNKCKVNFCFLAVVAFLVLDVQALTEDEDADGINHDCWMSIDLIYRRMRNAVTSLSGESLSYSDLDLAVTGCRRAASALVPIQDWPEKFKSEKSLIDCRRGIVSVVQYLKDVCHIFCKPEWSKDSLEGYDPSDPYQNLDVQFCE